MVPPQSTLTSDEDGELFFVMKKIFSLKLD
ncbi:hypothetical protein [Bacillus fungorum]